MEGVDERKASTTIGPLPSSRSNNPPLHAPSVSSTKTPSEVWRRHAQGFTGSPINNSIWYARASNAHAGLRSTGLDPSRIRWVAPAGLGGNNRIGRRAGRSLLRDQVLEPPAALVGSGAMVAGARQMPTAVQQIGLDGVVEADAAVPSHDLGVVGAEGGRGRGDVAGAARQCGDARIERRHIGLEGGRGIALRIDGDEQYLEAIAVGTEGR